jgi:general secretion pathway protein K
VTSRTGRPLRPRRGFVLLAVLWVMVGFSALGLSLSLAGRDAVSTAANRVSLARARWLAEGCVEVVLAVAAEWLSDRTRVRIAWRALDEVVASSPLVRSSGCDVSVRAAGATLDVNAADAEQLRRLMLALGLLPVDAESVVDAVLDWRDRDDVPRALGAERASYEAAHGFVPRNGPFADARELARVRGLDRLTGLDSVLGVERARIALGRAPRPVIAALPGITSEAVERIVELRTRGALPADLLALAGGLPPMARDSLVVRFSEFVTLATIDPDGWIVTARARDGQSPAIATVEVRVARGNGRAAVVRRRSWP